MTLSVPSSNSGSGLASLLRQGRPAKIEDTAPEPRAEPSTTVSLRPLGRSGIDSTQRGTAQITAALTVYLSKLGGTEEPASARPATDKTASAAASSPAAARTDVADLLRTLDGYRTGLRLTA